MTYFQGQKQNTYYPKRPLHSFQDLEVYQKTLECSVIVGKRLDEWLAVAGSVADVVPSRVCTDVVIPMPKLRPVEAMSQKGRKGTGGVLSTSGDNRQRNGNIGIGTARELITKNLLLCGLAIPHQVAEAHSLRFGDHVAGIMAIEKAMLNCNKMVVYLEQFRDICESGIEWEFFDDVIKKYLYVRRKMLNLERAWKKFMPGFEEKDKHVT